MTYRKETYINMTIAPYKEYNICLQGLHGVDYHTRDIYRCMVETGLEILREFLWVSNIA